MTISNRSRKTYEVRNEASNGQGAWSAELHCTNLPKHALFGPHLATLSVSITPEGHQIAFITHETTGITMQQSTPPGQHLTREVLTKWASEATSSLESLDFRHSQPRYRESARPANMGGTPADFPHTP